MRPADGQTRQSSLTAAGRDLMKHKTVDELLEIGRLLIISDNENAMTAWLEGMPPTVRERAATRAHCAIWKKARLRAEALLPATWKGST